MGEYEVKGLLPNTYPYPPENNRLESKYGGQTFRPTIFYPHFPPDSYPLAYFVQPRPPFWSYWSLLYKVLEVRPSLGPTLLVPRYLGPTMFMDRPTLPILSRSRTLRSRPYICIHYRNLPYPLPYPIAPLYVLQSLYIDREDRQTTLET
jgi:hypothetical protein